MWKRRGELLLVAAAVLVAAVRPPAGAALVNAAGAGPRTLSSLSSAPRGLQDAVARTLGSAPVAYTVTKRARAVVARTGGLSTRFGDSGPVVTVGGSAVRFTFEGVGYGGSLLAPRRSAPVASGAQVAYARGGGVTEWYRNGPDGLEQGFTITNRLLRHDRTGRLRLAINLAGSLLPRLDGDRVVFSSLSDRSRDLLSYGALSVSDATGRSLPSSLALRGGTLLLLIDDAHARYPLRVDPLIQQGARLSAPVSPVSGAEFGDSVALSADGDTALVGAPDYASRSGATGAAFVFVESGGVWVQQGTKLLPSDADTANPSDFGSSVALSADGNTALIGGDGDDSQLGAAWVFTRSGCSWSQQGSKLVPSGAPAQAYAGASVALSSDGNTALIGAPGGASGSAYVFTRSGATWTQQSQLAGAGVQNPAYGDAEFGSSVALSSDGNTALVGAFDDGTVGEVSGSAFVFTRSGSSWSQQGAKLTVSGTKHLGWGVSLSGDGDTALIGGEGSWVFTRSDATWTEQSALPAGGSSVSLSSDGNTALVGNQDGGGSGVATVLTQSNGTWTVQSTLTGSIPTGYGSFGSSVALSADGTAAFVGAPDDSTDTAWAFAQNGGSWAQSPTSTPLAGLDSPEAGFSVAVSADGDTAAVGAPGYDGNAGVVWVYDRSGTSWQLANQLAAPNNEEDNSGGGGEFGASVALSADGNTLLVGAPANGSTGAGAVWLLTDVGQSWESAELTPDDEDNSAGGGQFGGSVALSSSGTTALVGGPLDADGAGAAWVFTGSGTSWTQDGPKLTPRDEDNSGGGGLFGDSAALSAAGGTALVGGPYDGTSSDPAGAAWVFTSSGGTWSQQGSKLTPDDEDNSGGGGLFGWSVALSGTGTSALVGAPADGADSAGAAWVFDTSGTSWTQQGAKLTPDDEDNSGVGGEFGSSVALASDGATALIGAPDDGGSAGAAWTFLQSGSSWVQAGAKLTPSDEDNLAGGGLFGFSTALSSDASTALIGAPDDGSGAAGTAWAFTETASSDPGAPTGVSASPGDGQATITFSPPESNGGAPIASYTVTASPGGQTATGSSSPIAITGLTNGRSYTFTVTATNSVGPGPPSSPSNAVTPELTTPPGPPSGISAVAGNGQATVSFSPPTSNGGSAISSYTVSAAPGGAQASGSASPITVSGLANGTSYTFTVTATNTAGAGPASVPSNAVVPAASSAGGGGVSHGGDGGGGSDFISVSLSPGSQTVPVGGTASWSVTVTNTGGNYVGDVAVSDASVSGCSQTSGQSAGLYSMAPTVSVTYTCSGSVSGDLTNTVNASAVGPAGDTVTASASATVTVAGSAYPSPPVAKTPSDAPRVTQTASTVATLSLAPLKTVLLKTVRPSIRLTARLSKGSVLTLLLDGRGRTLARWSYHAKAGSNTITLLLPKDARKAGADRLIVSQTGAKKPQSEPLTLRS